VRHVVAKVVGSDGTISPDVEAKAIRWAVAQGARVISLSLGGVRDPLDPRRDTYSSLEANAVEYAASHGVVVVAAVGNGDEAPNTPWLYASYPAALPHVLGVSALGQDGSVPFFSNRDAIYNDISAPGADILSTFPRALTAARPTCPDQGYFDCGTQEYRNAEGTSFAAPQVAAAAALLFSANPALTADQVRGDPRALGSRRHSVDRLPALPGVARPALRLGTAGCRGGVAGAERSAPGSRSLRVE
jgi:subtilisin family serine protease